MNIIELTKTPHEKISSFSSFEVASVIILLIVKFSVKGNTKAVSFGRIALIYDKSIDSERNLFFKNYINPWFINSRIKKCILILVQTEYLDFVKSNGDVKYKLTSKGDSFIKSIEDLKLFTELAIVVMNESAAVTESLISNYRLLVK